MTAVAEKLAAMRADLAERESALVAFSGGVDSGVVAAVAADTLDVRALACTAKSEPLPPEDLEGATELAGEIGIRHEIVECYEIASVAFRRNDERRCYHCRTMRLTEMFERATELGEDGLDRALDPAFPEATG